MFFIHSEMDKKKFFYCTKIKFIKKLKISMESRDKSKIKESLKIEGV